MQYEIVVVYKNFWWFENCTSHCVV